MKKRKKKKRKKKKKKKKGKKKRKKKKVLPGLEPGLQGSKPWVLTNYTIEPLMLNRIVSSRVV